MEWLFYAIIVGIISSVFNKNKKPNNQPVPNRPEKKQVPSSQNRQYQRDWDAEFEGFDDFEDFQRTKEESLPRNERKDLRREKNISYNKPKASPRKSVYRTEIESGSQKIDVGKSEIYNEDVQQVKTFKKSYNELDNQKYLPSFNQQNVGRKEVIQGMIWSEIFGKPRSKNPHSGYGRRYK